MKSASKITLWPVVVMRPARGRKVSAGRPRLEGKEYVVRDGDVIYFRFNV